MVGNFGFGVSIGGLGARVRLGLDGGNGFTVLVSSWLLLVLSHEGTSGKGRPEILGGGGGVTLPLTFPCHRSSLVVDALRGK